MGEGSFCRKSFSVISHGCLPSQIQENTACVLVAPRRLCALVFSGVLWLDERSRAGRRKNESGLLLLTSRQQLICETDAVQKGVVPRVRSYVIESWINFDQNHAFRPRLVRVIQPPKTAINLAKQKIACPYLIGARMLLDSSPFDFS